MPEELLRLPRVIERTGLGRASIYARIKRGDFPQPIQLGVRAVAWTSSSIDEWVAAQITAGRRAVRP